jgi:hypothetical protein
MRIVISFRPYFMRFAGRDAAVVFLLAVLAIG